MKLTQVTARATAGSTKNARAAASAVSSSTLIHPTRPNHFATGSFRYKNAGMIGGQ